MKRFVVWVLSFAMTVTQIPLVVLNGGVSVSQAQAQHRAGAGHRGGFSAASSNRMQGARTRPHVSKPAARPSVQRPSVQPSRPTTRPSQPVTRPSQPSVRPSQPTTRPSQPTTRPSQPTTRPSQPTTRPSQPSTRPNLPGSGSRPVGSRPPAAQLPSNRPEGARPPGNRPPGTRPPGNRPPGSRPPNNRPPEAGVPGRPGGKPPGWRPPGWRPPSWRPPYYRPPYHRPPHHYWGSYYWYPSWGWYFTAIVAGSTLAYITTLPSDDDCQKVQDGTDTLYSCNGVLYRPTYYKEQQVYEIVSPAEEEIVEAQDMVGLALTNPMTRGPAVRDLQNLLVGFGYDVGSADGVFGTDTEAALLWLQYDNELEQTGMVDDATARILGLLPPEAGTQDAPSAEAEPAEAAPAPSGEAQPEASDEPSAEESDAVAQETLDALEKESNGAEEVAPKD